MKGYDLIKGIGHLDEDIVEEALTAEAPAADVAPVKEPRRFLRLSRMRWVAAAACIAIAVFAGWGITKGERVSVAPMESAGAPMVASDSAKNAMDSETAYAVAEEAPQATEEEDVLDESMAIAEAETEPAGVPETYAGEPAEAAAAVAEVPIVAEAADELEAVSEMVQGYPGDYSSACYAVPLNGEVGYSMPLQDAMAEYDNAVTYRVYVDIFKGEALLDPAGQEVAELFAMLSRDCGITTVLEKAAGPDGKKTVYPTLHATFEQLRHFPVDEDHGWMLYLYDERVE